jgi:hypothetical protein
MTQRMTLSLLRLLILIGLLPIDRLSAADGGLSAEGSQYFRNENLLFYGPDAGDNFAWVVASGDFNGDGAADLATGMPGDNGLLGFEIADCGAVVVRYGIPGTGLAGGLATTFLNQIVGGSPDPAEVDDRFGSALAACDLNGDGFDDLAVGAPMEDSASGATNSGAVDIYLGSRSGLPAAAKLHLDQSTRGIPGDPELFDLFGFSLACGDLDRDGFDDLAIGIAGESIEDQAYDAGSLLVVFGGPGGLDLLRVTSLNQESDGVEGAGEDYDRFGGSLAVGDFDDDNFADLAVGVVGEDNPGGDGRGRGAVQVFFGSIDGIDVSRDLLYTEDDFGGDPEEGDRLGWALAAGDFDGDAFDDLAIGVPFKDGGIGNIVDGGHVIVLPGAVGGFDLQQVQFWSEDSFPGTAIVESGDQFGFALAAGDFDDDGHDDLAIGAPGQDDELLELFDDGEVIVVMGSKRGLAPERHLAIREGQGGFPGRERFYLRAVGRALASGDFDGNGVGDLAIGVPLEDIFFPEWSENAGAELVAYGSRADPE